MKTRMTFRMDPLIADHLRELPNQTAFVESVLREALGMTCPICDGTGIVAPGTLAVTNFRAAGLPPLEREAALNLKRVVKLARCMIATDVAIAQSSGGYGFVVSQNERVLMRGDIDRSGIAIH